MSMLCHENENLSPSFLSPISYLPNSCPSQFQFSPQLAMFRFILLACLATQACLGLVRLNVQVGKAFVFGLQLIFHVKEPKVSDPFSDEYIDQVRQTDIF